MRIVLLGAAGFIGTNIIMELAKNTDNVITAVDQNLTYLQNLEKMNFHNLRICVSNLTVDVDYEQLVENQDVV